MRTFHIGGTAQAVEAVDSSSRTSMGSCGCEIAMWCATSEGRRIVMGRNISIVIEDADGTERATHRLTAGARLHVDEGDEIKRGQRIAEWDPYTRPDPYRGGRDG